jgi:hypothetical protein
MMRQNVPAKDQRRTDWCSLDSLVHSEEACHFPLLIYIISLEYSQERDQTTYVGNHLRRVVRDRGSRLLVYRHGIIFSILVRPGLVNRFKMDNITIQIDFIDKEVSKPVFTLEFHTLLSRENIPLLDYTLNFSRFKPYVFRDADIGLQKVDCTRRLSLWQ